MTPAVSMLLLFVMFPVLAQGMDNHAQGSGQGYSLQSLRNIIRKYSNEDTCPSHSTIKSDVHYENSKKIKDPGLKRTLEDCKYAMKIYQMLTEAEKAACPNIRNPGCRRCDTASKSSKKLHCGYHCDPTQAERNAAVTRGTPIPAFVCKHLRDLLGPGHRLT